MIRKTISKVLFRLAWPEIYKYEKQYEKSQWMGKEEIEKLQLRKLKKLLEYAYKNVPFYRKLWDSKKIDYSIDSLKDLEKFPVVDKNMLQKAIKDKEISGEYLDLKNISWESTTGSSGRPFKFPLDIDSANKRGGMKKRIYKWYGLDYGIKWARFWRGSLKLSLRDKIIDFILRRKSYCIYDPKYPKECALDDKKLGDFVKGLNKEKPKVIDGFVSSLVLLSKYIIKNNIKINYVKSVVTGAECLFDEDRKLISEAFNCLVFNRYGGTESSVIAHECEVQSRLKHKLHIQGDRIYIEIWKNGKSVKDELGEVVFTDLENKALPFIRYKIGDLARINSEEKCSCGRTGLLLLDGLEGRVNDMFKLPNGKMITSHLWQNYFKKCQGIDTYQMVQEKKDYVIINYIINKSLFKEKEFQKVRNLVSEALKGCKIIWNEVRKINRGAGGKFRQHISKVM